MIKMVCPNCKSTISLKMVKHLMNDDYIGIPQLYKCVVCDNEYYLVFDLQRCLPYGCEEEPIRFSRYVNDRTVWLDGRESEW